MTRPRIGQGLGVRWPAAGVVTRRVRIGIGAQHIWRENEKRAPEVLMQEKQDRRAVTAQAAGAVHIVLLCQCVRVHSIKRGRKHGER
jgi:hypothetical protein